MSATDVASAVFVADEDASGGGGAAGCEGARVDRVGRSIRSTHSCLFWMEGLAGVA